MPTVKPPLSWSAIVATVAAYAGAAATVKWGPQIGGAADTAVVAGAALIGAVYVRERHLTIRNATGPVPYIATLVGELTAALKRVETIAGVQVSATNAVETPTAVDASTPPAPSGVAPFIPDAKS